jgi:hypothetical protein
MIVTLLILILLAILFPRFASHLFVLMVLTLTFDSWYRVSEVNSLHSCQTDAAYRAEHADDCAARFAHYGKSAE